MGVGLYGKDFERAFRKRSMRAVVSCAPIVGFFVDSLTSPDVEIHIRQIVHLPTDTGFHRITA